MHRSNKLFRKFTLTLSTLLFFYSSLSAQFDVSPCTDPDNNGIGCFCETAGFICSPDELDGFEFSMSEISNIGGLSGDLCPGLPDGGAPHNVNFFALVVWCESLTFDVLINNCAPGTNDVSNINNFGIQMALFANCPSDNGEGWDPIQCVTNGGETCFNSAAEVPNSQTFTASGLEIGGTYYFMVDGCFQSTCDITIDVQGSCGTGEITSWNNGILGPQNVCIGTTETYIAEDIAVGLDGAEEYYYYVDGVLIDEGEEQYTIDITWDTPGNYELCVDVSNLPCIPESDAPSQNCISILVREPGDGDIQADATQLCPSEESTITVENTSADPALSEYIIILNQDGIVIKIVEGSTTSFTYGLCGDLTAYYYSFVSADNPSLPNMGEFWTLPDCVDNCCYLDAIDISYTDTESPEFTDPPVDMTLACADDINENEEISWTDNCTGNGTVMPVLEENFTLCDGGTIQKTWTITDNCANEETYTQIITLEPIPEAVYMSPPADTTIDCATAQTFIPPNLGYSNMDVGPCEISGSTSPITTGSFDLCGGALTYVWEFTDMCGRTTNHSQEVFVDPIEQAFFINPPSDITIQCDEIETYIPVSLMYTNGGSGDCLIEGTISPTSDGILDTCGIEVIYSWEFVDFCGRVITHSQTVTVDDDVLHSVPSDIDNKRINVFPNPFYNQITIAEAGFKKSDISIFSFTGQNLTSMISIRLNDEHAVVETDRLVDGMYILKVGEGRQLICKYSME